MKFTATFFFVFCALHLLAQKKPLDHSVYDSWQSIGEKLISHDGKWVVYTVTPQEGDADLYIQSTDGSGYKKQIPRGYNALITEDSRFVVFKIRPAYKETREARIKKKRPEDFPKDSLGIIELGNDQVFKLAKIKSYKTPEKTGGWVAYHKERDPAPTRSSASPTQKTVDSLKKTIDSLVLLVTQLKNVKAGHADDAGYEPPGSDDPVQPSATIEGSDLVLRRLHDGKEKVFRGVVDYFFNAYGQKLVMRVAGGSRDSFNARAVVVYDLQKSRLDTILKGGNDFRNFALTEDGKKIAFVAERDTAKKALQQFYDLYLFREGGDSAVLFINKHSVGMEVGNKVSEHASVSFSKSGNRLFFGTVPIQPMPDTSLVEIDLVKLDIWHYKDDYLQTQQLARLNNELRRSYLAVYDFQTEKMEQLATEGLPTVMTTGQGDGEVFVAITDTGRRVEAQWTGRTKKDIYAINLKTGERKLVKKNHDGNIYPSSTGKYILLYDSKARHYLAWDGKGLKNISSKIKTPLYNEEHDTPDDPNPYGLMGWHEGDSAVYVYDRFDVWRIDPAGLRPPVNVTKMGRTGQLVFRYVPLDREKQFFRYHDTLAFKVQDYRTKKTGYNLVALHEEKMIAETLPEQVNGLVKSKQADSYIYTKESYERSPDLYLSHASLLNYPLISTASSVRLSSLNPQQSQYNWGSAELFRWKAFDGKPSTGILYKPEDFDSTKKYPVIFYFYEKLSDGLYNYIPPAPTPSRLNISFFVSRGYLVLAPDIRYTRGLPAKSAYNYVVSAAQAMAKKKWVDAKNMGIQGQSWGGIQVVQLITMTDMFRAAWAGAPVANMFSAYGGIRWESGNNRQFQYEKGQSRIGATPWERPDLYLESSPFFHLKKIKTPLVIMHNDADGAVPWYQGIELFTAMRRLGKQVWMLNYNGEAHNLVERKNRKDIQIREQQFFDWLLKGERPPRWIVEGVPAAKKGRDWGLELIY